MRKSILLKRKEENMAKKKVLLIGIDPKLIDPNLSTATGWDANRYGRQHKIQTKD
jgi:hypothetical protein